MRVIRTGSGHRAGVRWRPGAGRAPALPAWARARLAALKLNPAARRLWEQRRPLSEAALYIGFYLVYLFTGGLAYADPRAVGIANGERIAAFQERLGFLWEPGWQAWAIDHIQGLVVFLNWAYIVTYWPVILALAVFLFLRNRQQYYYYRTVILLNLTVALLVFMLFPVASPFAVPPTGLIDTIQTFGPTAYGTETMANFYNTTAAMPSLHFSWTVILGVYWCRTLPGGFKAAGLLYPAMTFFTITITGNHFILDAIAGGTLAGLAFGLVELARFLRRKTQREYPPA